MPLLGWIPFRERTLAMMDAHHKRVLAMPRLELADIVLAPGQKVALYDSWASPDVVADVGFIFPRFHQLTGSCVGAGGGNALYTLIAVQRLLADNPTKAFIPFWPFDYGRCRYEEGDRGQGEGATGSAFADSVKVDGVIDAASQGLPVFSNDDGLVLTDRLEMQWSDGAAIDKQWIDMGKVHPVGSAAQLQSASEVKAAILNGYPVTVACDNYIGSASVEGSGGDACLIGYWDGRGGHQQSIHAYWEHPRFGPLYWAQNNWPGSTYPRDPAGGPICGCWVREAKLSQVWSGLDGEVYAFSHLSWFPAQPKVLDWFA